MVTYASRKFIDEIYKRGSRWPIWSPPQRIEVGTFGQVNRETGEFEPRGNIYRSPEIQARMPSLNEPQCQPQPGEQMEEQFTILSSSMTLTNIGAEVNMGIYGTFQFRIDVNNGKRGAFLVLQSPHSTYFPVGAINMRRLAEIPLLEEMFLVTEAIKCPSFVMGLTSKGQRAIQLTMRNEVPTMPTPDAGGSVVVRYGVEHHSSFLRRGSDPHGQPSFTPLVKLIKITGKWKRWYWERTTMRDSPPLEPSEDEIWEDVFVPWSALDDDGLEKEITDDVSDDDDDNEGDEDDH